ncbi:glycosyltransferase [Rhodopirellula sallentina]|uniref:Glycosyl transferase, group 1 family protein n=1 Tax=Rhodopirellula sallentina SM41 TaxID=1263870 RepID=M5U635_9BACT|nr:glycosyltransferase [Rhodopirellula sallentina]EMI56915.1 glycosyl transferase, group 1 family protein [Rhodopirellula sallentina SM41]
MKTDSKVTICQFVHSLSVGGAEMLARDFAIAAAPEFHTVFACLDEVGTLGEQLIDSGYTVECFERKPGLDRSLMRRLSHFCQQHDVDLIHAHQYTPFVYAAMSRFSPWWKAWRALPPVLFTEHGRHYPDVRKSKRVLANQVLLRRRDRCVAVGNNVKQALIDKEGIAAARIDVVYNGINLERFARCEQARQQSRQGLELEPDDVAVFQVARLNPLKDHATAVLAWTHLKDVPHVKLVIVGDGELRASTEELIQQHGLEDQVCMLGTRYDVAEIINAADLMMLTSISEGIPLTLIEAMANGLPCVASRVGGVPEVIVDGENGYLIESGDVHGFSSSIRRLSAEQGLRERLGSNAKARAFEHFSDQVMHDAYHQLYRSLTSELKRS